MIRLIRHNKEKDKHSEEIDEAGCCRQGRQHCNLEQIGKQIVVQLCHLPETRYTVVEGFFFHIRAECHLKVCVFVFFFFLTN